MCEETVLLNPIAVAILLALRHALSRPRQETEPFYAPILRIPLARSNRNQRLRMNLNARQCVSPALYSLRLVIPRGGGQRDARPHADASLVDGLQVRRTRSERSLPRGGVRGYAAPFIPTGSGLRTSHFSLHPQRSISMTHSDSPTGVRTLKPTFLHMFCMSLFSRRV
jgi:hypothetical protein